MKSKLLTFVFFYFAAVLSAQTTYRVTSTSLTGPGSFLEAVDLANANPGPDVIEFTDGLQVNATGAFNYSGESMVRITESLVIDGKGGALIGKQSWINKSGNQTIEFCPDKNENILTLAFMPGFLEVGKYGQNNSDIEVTVKDLTIEQFNQIALVNKNASLTLEGFKAYQTWASYKCSGESQISVGQGASLTIRKCDFRESQNWSTFGPFITGAPDAGDLNIEETEFALLNLGDNYAIAWDGQAGARVNIVSSRFRRSGCFYIVGEVSETNIVNTVWTNYYFNEPEYGDRIINGASGDMNITASTLIWNTYDCDLFCQNSNSLGGSLIQRLGSGKINFYQSAVGFNFEAVTPEILNTLGDDGVDGFTADEYTWIQPTVAQDAATLKAMTGQPALRTGLPAFTQNQIPLVDGFDLKLATPVFPGELIDVIPSSVALINPITGLPIETDVVGNPRNDANGERDIGAIQLALAPLLTVGETGNGQVALSWNEPLHHDGLSILKYELRYFETGSSSATTVTIDPPALEHTVTALTNGTEYTFEVRAIYTGPENGPYSNQVVATPFGEIGTPVVTAVPGDKEVELSWTLPDLGGRTFEGYKILWREAGSTEFTDALAYYNPGTTTTTITGLNNGTTYEFAVAVNASGATSEQGLATATPIKPAGPVGDNCTLTAGYWSTHSEYGPSPYNATWTQLYAGADTEFFLSGQSYYEVINSSVDDNVYYNLAQQYIATKLNILQGADSGAIQAEFDQATASFETSSPDDLQGLKGNDPLRKSFLQLSRILTEYNEGFIGPGHCDETAEYALKAIIDQTDKSGWDTSDLNSDDLAINYPNPFSEETFIRYELLNTGMVTINVYDLKGILIKTLVNGYQDVGVHEISWDGTNKSNREMPDGIYILHIQTNDNVFVNKMLISKE